MEITWDTPKDYKRTFVEVEVECPTTVSMVPWVYPPYPSVAQPSDADLWVWAN